MLKDLEEKLDCLIRKRAAKLLNGDYSVVCFTLKGFWKRINEQYPSKVNGREVRDIFEIVTHDIKSILDYVRDGKEIETRSGAGVVYGRSESMKAIGDYYIKKASDQIMAEAFQSYEIRYKSEPEEPDPEASYQVRVVVRGQSRDGTCDPADIYPLLAGRIAFQPNATEAYCAMRLDELMDAFPFIGEMTWRGGERGRLWRHIDWKVGNLHFNVRYLKRPEDGPAVYWKEVKELFKKQVEAENPEIAYVARPHDFMVNMVDAMSKEIASLRSLVY